MDATNLSETLLRRIISIIKRHRVARHQVLLPAVERRELHMIWSENRFRLRVLEQGTVIREI